MNEKQVLKYIKDKFQINKEPFNAKNLDILVFKHRKNQKWFALLFKLNSAKFGLDDKEILVLNLKCSPDLASLLRDDKEIFPAYHMNKKHWISLNLSTQISEQKVYDLIDESFKLTKAKNS